MKVFGYNVPFTGEKFNQAQQNAHEAVANYRGNQRLMNVVGSSATKEEAAAAKTAARELNSAGLSLKAARGDFFASIRYMFAKMGEVVGIKPSAKVSAEYATNVTKLANGGRAGVLERMASKPFRVIGNNPKKAVAAAALIAIFGIGSKIKRNAEQRTQNEAMQQAAEIQAMAEAQQSAANSMAYPQAAAAPTSYKDSVTQAEWNAANAQFRENAAAGSHAERLAQSQQPAVAPSL